ACSLGVAFFVGWRVSSSIGGVTGDVYGAICEIAEVASLAAFAFRAA
ncbi:MAG: adenosylcobinamide-GDP ribazoletransferase, partial [Firmicutes bacterium]|nr:adenosylcobinamide-GDP ribazoletransferase [Bacillota bacterium]